jgi:glycosyltransferase involved in cell wall biosynthesis
MIAFHFPPSNAAGTYRSMRFAKYLVQRGWKVSVLTVDASGKQKDAGLLVPEGVSVYRARAFNTLSPIVRVRNALRKRIKGDSRTSAETKPGSEKSASGKGPWQRLKDALSLILTFPDSDIGWFPRAVLRGWKVMRQNSIDIIYSTGPPHSSHLIGRALKLVTRKPWVADFRDPWARQAWLSEHEKQSWRTRAIEVLEARTVKAANQVLLCTEPMLDSFVAQYPQHAQRKFTYIPNGFDPDEYHELAAARRSGPFRITHAGSMYRKRSPMAILLALRSLIQEGAFTENEIELELIGSISLDGFSVEAAKEELELHDVVRWTPYLPHAECLSRLCQTDVLLIIQPEADVQIPGKIYEYLRIGKAILGLVHPGATADFITANKLGYVANPDRVEEVAETIRTLFVNHKNGRPWPGTPPHLLEKFDARTLVNQLDDVFSECIAQG